MSGTRATRNLNRKHRAWQKKIQQPPLAVSKTKLCSHFKMINLFRSLKRRLIAFCGLLISLALFVWYVMFRISTRWVEMWCSLWFLLNCSKLYLFVKTNLQSSNVASLKFTLCLNAQKNVAVETFDEFLCEANIFPLRSIGNICLINNIVWNNVHGTILVSNDVKQCSWYNFGDAICFQTLFPKKCL